MRLYDAHNHLQDDRFGGRQFEMMSECVRVGVARMVVNGSCESDWPRVAALAEAHPQIIPSFGYHPWHIGERTPAWEARLVAQLDRVPSAVGEIGLDRWKAGLLYEGQEEVFVAQMRLATARERAVSIHCLRAWGRLLTLLQDHPRPGCGFLMHSYGGPVELVVPLARLGAYFSFPGYFARPDKVRQQQAFRAVPADRLLIETDAPDQRPPDSLNRHPWVTAQAGGTASGGWAQVVGMPIGSAPALNHPANLVAVYEFVARLLGEPVASLAARVEENFLRLFRGL